ncbi:hypothetical protein R69658_08231 [Paraburkholderia aspalathi]|uniref:Uncharacterized protein n=1 Tax=Paraburkholderia aspalathi TaxID=1324617 RepID=A0ABM8T9D9_9BURK|nr:hypothetical protein R69658_08231 [Paraburkholderia aspalathi]
MSTETSEHWEILLNRARITVALISLLLVTSLFPSTSGSASQTSIWGKCVHSAADTVISVFSPTGDACLKIGRSASHRATGDPQTPPKQRIEITLAGTRVYICDARPCREVLSPRGFLTADLVAYKDSVAQITIDPESLSLSSGQIAPGVSMST